MSGPGSPKAVSQTVIVIDNGPILLAEQERLRTTKKKYDVVNERLVLHQKYDEPQYQQWFNANFGIELSNIRTLYTRLTELDLIVFQVQQTVEATDCDPLDAYETILEQRARTDKARDEARDEACENAKRTRHADGDDEGPDDDSKASEREGFSGRDHTSREDEFGRTTNASKKPSGPKAQIEQIKTIYRILVRQLHPDLNPDVTQSQRELWFDVQQAYSDQDLARLEMILARQESEKEGSVDVGDESFIGKIQSLTRLRLLLKSLAKKIKKTQRALTQAKRAPAWEFHKIKRDPRRMNSLVRHASSELSDAAQTLASDIRTYEAQIESWTRRSSARRSRRSRNQRYPYEVNPSQ